MSTTQSWAQGPLCTWDTETTGVDPETARIVTSATVSIRPGQTPQPTEWLLDPGVEIPEAAAKVHGITTNQARAQGVEAAGGVEAIVQGILAEITSGVPLVIYNAAYDLTVLDRECRRHGLAPLVDRVKDAGAELRVVDPFVLDKAVDRYRKGKRTLSATSAHYGVGLSEDEAHTAAGDCLAAARVAWKIAKQYPQIGTQRLSSLHEFQRVQFAEQAAGLEAWFRKQGKNESVSREWPMKTYREEVDS